MPAVTLHPGHWGALRNGSGLDIRRHVSTTGNFAHVSQRVAISSVPMPTVSGSSELIHEWGNEQQVAKSSGGFTSESGFTPILVIDKWGLRQFSTAGLEGGGFSIGEGFHWEEGVFLCIAPLSEIYLGNDPGTLPEGRLSLRAESALSGRFWWTQANAAGTDIEEFEFDDIDVPLTYQGSQIPPKPIYFRFIRNMPPGGAGRLHLRVWADGAATTQAITGVPKPNATSVASAKFGTQPVGTTVAGHLLWFWWRSKFSDTYAGSTTFGVSTYWNTPKVFQSDLYYSHGGSPVGFIDSGQTDAYWRSIEFPEVPRRGGGTLEFRAVATNSIPGGSGSSLTSGASYTTITGNHQSVELEDIQGRYLVIDLRFVPGSQIDLDFAEAAIQSNFGGTAEMGRAVWSDVAQAAPGGGTVEIQFAGEGDSEATLPFSPHFTGTQSQAFRVSAKGMEFPYTVTRALGSGSRKTWPVRWVLDAADTATLLAFFDARRGGEGAFTFTPVGTQTPITAALGSGSVSSQKRAPNVFEITAEFVEVKP